MNCGCEYTSFPTFQGLPSYSRYTHSLGAALIVWHFTNDRVQAMSALLHDVDTPVFAHVIDFLHGDHMTQESTESGTTKRIQSSKDLCALLEKLGISISSVDDYHHYPIADNDSPKLSSDRLEYTLQNSVNYGILSPAQAKCFYDDLIVGTNEFGETELIFQTETIAKQFAQAALACGKIYVSDEDRYAMQALALLLRDAIAEGVLCESDLYTTEEAVIQKLCNSSFITQWTAFCNLNKLCVTNTPSDTNHSLQIFAKKRYIDPFVQGLGRVSGLDPIFNKQLDTFLQSPQDYWLTPIS
jgi:HD superfamily phosphohydrolase